MTRWTNQYSSHRDHHTHYQYILTRYMRLSYTTESGGAPLSTTFRMMENLPSKGGLLCAVKHGVSTYEINL